MAAALVLWITFDKNTKQLPQTEDLSTPKVQRALSGVTVCIDPGHGGYDGGAVGKNSGVMEKALNLQLSQKLQSLLKDSGAEVILTRSSDIALASEGDERKRRDLQARVDASQGADVFISLHMNEYADRSQSGPQVFYTSGDENSRLLAGAMQKYMNELLSPARPRSANTGDYYVLRNQSMPAVLVECGFLSNAEEEQKLQAEDYQWQVAQSIHAGLCEFLRVGQSLAIDR